MKHENIDKNRNSNGNLLKQIYHHCAVGNRYDFLCPNYTLFDQTTFTCRFINTVDCTGSAKHFDRNNALYVEKDEKDSSASSATSTSSTSTTTTTTQSPTKLNIQLKSKPSTSSTPAPVSALSLIMMSQQQQQQQESSKEAPTPAGGAQEGRRRRETKDRSSQTSWERDR